MTARRRAALHFGILLFLAVPFIAAAVLQQHDVTVQVNAGTPAVTLSSGDIGTPTLGASATSASVAVGTLPVLVANDALRLTTTSAGWTVHAEHITSTGFGGLLQEITVSLAVGATNQAQIHDSYLGLLQATGTGVSLEPGAPVEMRLLGEGTGTLDLDLVLVPATGIELRYPVTITVG